MSKSGPEKLKMETANNNAENVEKIAGLFPGVITEIEDDEGKLRKGIDFDLLKQELSGDYVEGREERYEFTWVGKNQSIVEANLPIQRTLRPCIEESKNWDKTENIYIEGDNLDALKLLQESYLNKVKMIYIDPPYNTGNDFIYNDSFVMDVDEYDEETGAVDENGNYQFTKRNTKDRGRYHSDWCSLLYSRLKLSHNLLKDDGVIFVSIDDNEVHNLRKMMTEIFGEDNFIANIVWQKKYGPANDAKTISDTHEHILCFSKNIESWKPNLVPRSEDQLKAYSNPDNDPRGDWRVSDFSARSYSKNGDYPITLPSGRIVNPPPSRSWITNEESYKKLLADNRICFGIAGDGRPMQKKFLSEVRGGITPQTWWSRDFAGDNKIARYEIKEIFPENVFDTPKPSKLIYRMIEIGCTDGIVLDFFAGSATTAHAVMKMNADDGGKRKFVLVQLPEACDEASEAYKAGLKNISEIGKERIRRVGEQIKKEIEDKKQQKNLDGDSKIVPDIGFRVFKIDDTNMKDVYYSAGEYSQETIEGLVDNVKEGRTDIDLLYQVLIDWGLPLDLQHETEDVNGFTIHIVDKNALIACFDANIPESVMRTIAGKKPLRAVFRDGSFISSPGKLNIEGIFKTIAPDTTLRVI